METTQFTQIAQHYDQLMGGVPYRLWVEYIENILSRFGARPVDVLDAACGTGTVSDLLKNKGYNLTGVDIAPDMIDIAKKRVSGVDFYVSDLAELDLDKTFDLAICLFDSLNYITEDDHLEKAIERISSHLRPGGLFIFDVNTVYALAHHFFDQANLESDNYPKYVWTSDYDNKTRLCTINMIFTVRDNGKERQFKEVHYQKGYLLEELEQMIISAGLELVDKYQAYKFKRPTRRSDRVYFVTRKTGQ